MNSGGDNKKHMDLGIDINLPPANGILFFKHI